MVVERWKMVCPQEPWRLLVTRAQPDALCPTCKRERGRLPGQCNTSIKKFETLLKIPVVRAVQTPRPGGYKPDR